jgi:pimeloyl-ACP methyl ester carboxylesterase
MELVVQVDGDELPATLSLPTNARAGLVVLHGAEAGEREYFLYEHLAGLLAPQDVAVLRYDRRPSRDGHDVSLQIQAADAIAAIHQLREYVRTVPVGLWGFSQGAWVAPIAAVTEPESVDFLICVSASGVSPAEQMRDGCVKQLRMHGYSEADVAELLIARLAVEEYLRTGIDRAAAQDLLDRAAAKPWFPLGYLQPTLPQPGAWRDMDFRPEPVLADLVCPVLAFYGENDEWVPVEQSIAAWRQAEGTGALSDFTLVRLPGTGHLPTAGGEPEASSLSGQYSRALTTWMQSVVTGR